MTVSRDHDEDGHYIAPDLPDGGRPFNPEEFLKSAVVAPYEYFVEDCHRRSPQSGLRITTPSIVGVRPPVSSTTSLSRSPPGAMNETAGELSSDGVTPAVPPAWIGVRSWTVSEPLEIERFALVVVALIGRRT